MSETSWFFESRWATAYFRRTPEGQVFSCSLPSVFGGSREYQLNDARAEQLVAGIGRALEIGAWFVIFSLVVGIVLAQSFLAEHPFAACCAIAMFSLLLVYVSLGIVYWAASAVLSGLTWTSIPREPYSLAGHLKKVGAILTIFPTGLAVYFFVGSLMALPKFAIPAYNAVASGQVNFDNVWMVTLDLVMLVTSGTVLIAKLRAQ
jgi:hypothetical protein